MLTSEGVLLTRLWERIIATRVSTQHLAITMALLAALCMLGLPGATRDARALNTESFVLGQIIVKLAPGTTVADVESRYHLKVQECFLSCTYSAKTGIYLLRIPDGSITQSRTQSKLNKIALSELVSYAELNYLSGAPEADDATEANARHRAFPANDAEPTADSYSKYSYADNLSAAQQISSGRGTTVAVLDTGVQLDHPALKTWFKGVPRYDFVDDDRNPSEPPLAKNKEQRSQEVVGHGTHVAGIVHLVAPRAHIMPLRVLNKKGYGSVFHVAEAIAFADRKGADVINLSLGTPSWSKLLREEVDEAISDGAVVVAAAGNYDSTLPQYPASNGPLVWVASSTDGLLAATSVDAQMSKSDFANYGTWIDVAAPGEGILSTYPVSRYAYWSGTSMAAPFVSGQAALIYEHAVAVQCTLNPAGVEKQIRSSAQPLSEDPGHIMLGAGRADVFASLEQNPDPQDCL
jgi:thermitase